MKKSLQLLLFTLLVVCAPAISKAGLNDGLVAYWPFDGDVLDAFGDNDGEAMGTEPISFEPAMFGDGMRLNGEDQFVEITGSDKSVFDFEGGSMSISAWFTVDAFDTNWQALIAKGEGDRWRLHRSGSSSGLAWVGGNAGEAGIVTPAVDDGAFHNVVVSTDPDTNSQIWLDGVLIGESGGPSVLGNNDNPVRIGDNPDATGREWEGFIDDVAIWDRALTAEEIDTIYSGGEGKSIAAIISPPGLLGDFNLDGSIDLADYDILLANFRTGREFTEGNINLSGVVDFKDFLQFADVFAAANPGGAAVPEPSSIVLAVLGLVGLCLASCRSRRSS